MTDSPPDFNSDMVSRYRRGIISLALLGLIGLAVTCFPHPQPKAGKRSEANCRELTRKINAAIARMERRGRYIGHDEQIDGLEEAVRIFEELHEELPDELLPVQNLAVAKSLLFELSYSDDGVERYNAARDAINTLRKRKDGERAAALLEFRAIVIFAQRQKKWDYDNLLEEVQNALEQVPGFEQDGLAQFTLYNAINRDTENQVRKRTAFDAIRRAHLAMPDNLHLLRELLRNQLQEHDPAFVDRLRASRPKFESLSALELGQNYDSGGPPIETLKLIDAGIEAANEGNWLEAYRPVFTVLNVLMPTEAYRRDARALEIHPLDFVLRRLSDRFRATNPIPPRVVEPRSVEFKRMAAPRVAELSGVRDVQYVDFDLDSDEDWIVLQDRALWVGTTANKGTANNGTANEGTADEQTTEPTTLAIDAEFSHMFVADLDHDTRNSPAGITWPDYFQADPDLILYGSGGVLVVENRLDLETEQRTLVVTPQTFGLDRVRDVRSATIVDIDHDADLDLILVTGEGFQVWLNRGDRDFLEATEWAVLPAVEDGGVALFPVDWDRDGDLDVMVAAENLGTGILENTPHGQVVWRRFERPFPQSGTNSIAVFEADGNVSWDLATAGRQLQVVLTDSARDRAHRDRAPRALVAETLDKSAQRSVRAFDINNDSAVDLIVQNKTSVQVCYGVGDGTFEPLASIGVIGKDIQALLVTDLNDDGWLDMSLVDAGRVRTLTNQPTDGGHWLKLIAIGQRDNIRYAGHTGIGSLVEVTSGGRYQAQVVQSPITHFGLGKAKKADIVRISWTDGIPQSVIEPKTNQTLIEAMGF